jgi:hypothetical protein
MAFSHSCISSSSDKSIKHCLVFKHRNVGVFKKSTGSYIPLPAEDRGTADIIGCIPTGRFIAIESKVKGNKLTPEQLGFLDRVHRANGIGIVATSIDDVMRLL